MKKTKLPSIESIENKIESNEGWCINCEEWTHDCCEPDAEKYECPQCGKNTCYGTFELLCLY